MKPGEVFAHGKYTLLRKLRSSGMAEVWLARQHGTEGFAKDVVIKRILPHLAEDEKLVTMFLDEARIAANLSHPNVVQIFDLGNDGQDYFIAMEYIRGYDLEQIQEQLQHRRLGFPPEIAAKIIADTCLGLAYAHDCKTAEGTPMQVVHRDVSPQNILVSDTGVVKLIDFGIAKARTSSTRTQVGHTKGKICYMSPEQMMARELDRRSDIFSAGVVMYELICGTKPFDGDNLLACFHKLMKEGIVAPRVLRSDLSPKLESIIMTALERDREDRYPTATALRYELKQFLDGEGTMLGPEHLEDFLRWLFNPDDSTQIVFDLPRSTKSQSPRLPSTPVPTPSPSTPPPPPAAHTARKFGTEDRLSAPPERVTSGGSNPSQPFVVGSGPAPSLSFDEPSFGNEPGPVSHSMGSSPGMAIGHTGPQIGVGLSFDDDHSPYTPRGNRRKKSRRGGSVFLFVFIFLLLVGGGIGAAYHFKLIGDPGTTPPGPPTMGARADAGPGQLPAIPRQKVPDAGATKKATKAPAKKAPPRRRAKTRKRPRPRPRKRRPAARRRRRPRPRPRPRCRYGKITIDTKTKRARVNISDAGYVALPMLTPRRMRAGYHRFGFLWSGGYKKKSLRIRGCRTTRYFCILDRAKIRCEAENR